MLTDPIADMLIRIKNAQAVKKPFVNIPYSRMKYHIAKVLEAEGFVEEVKHKGKGPRKVIRIKLKYLDKKPVIHGAKRISKPGRRIYKGYRDLRPVKGGLGIAIISSSQGIITDKEAKERKVGGEVLFEIW